MNRRVHTIWAILTSLLIASTGCHPQQPFYLHEDGDLSHYIDVATEIEYPDVCTSTLEEVTQSVPPLTLDNLNVRQVLGSDARGRNPLGNGKRESHAVAGWPVRQLGIQQPGADRRSARRAHAGTRRGAHDLRPGHRRDHAVHRRRVRSLGVRHPMVQRPVLSEERPPTEREPHVSGDRLLPADFPAGHQHVQHAVDQDYGPGRSVQRPQQHRLRLQQQSDAPGRQGLERQLRSGLQPAVVGRCRCAVQPHRRSVQSVQRAARAGYQQPFAGLRRRAVGPDQRRHQPGGVRRRRPQPGQ